MMLVEMTEAPAELRGWVTRARRVPVVLTIKGRPVVALTPLEDGDWERLVVASHPVFRKILARSRARCRPGQGISTEALRKRLKRRRGAARAAAPRPDGRLSATATSKRR